MKNILFLLIFINLSSYAQIHIGEKSRDIYNFYKQKSGDVDFYSFGHAEFLVAYVDHVQMKFYFNENDICTTQVLVLNDRDKLYQLCDKLNIPLDWKLHNKVYKSKNIRISTSKQLEKGKLQYSVTIRSNLSKG